MSVQDLTVREVDEAKTYGLTPDQYDKLKEAFFQRTRQRAYDETRKQLVKEAADVRVEVEGAVRLQVRGELQKEIRQDLETRYTTEIRPKVRKELEADVRKELEAQITEEQRAAIRAEINAEIATTGPTGRQRDTTRAMIREVELEALSAAHAASVLAETEVKKLAVQRHWRFGVFYGLLLSMLPVLAHLHVTRGWRLDHPAFWAVAIPYVVATVISYNVNDNLFKEMRARIEWYRARAAECRRLAGKSREAWMVRVSAANTRGDLVQLVESLSNLNGYGQTFENSLPATALESARIHVKEFMSIDTDIDIERHLRVETSDSEPETRSSVRPDEPADQPARAAS